MMANESRDVPQRRALSDESVKLLRAAVLRHWLDPSSPGELKVALDRVAAEARERRMQAEDLIVAFKEVWDSVPELRGGSARGEELRLRERLITMTIKAYYE